MPEGQEGRVATAQRATISISKDYLHFSAAHFTIFSATERENLHGHNFFVEAEAIGEIGDDGLCFDYNALKQLLKELCDQLDETTLLPARSPHLDIEASGSRVTVGFGDERLEFLARDVTLLDVRNVTVEELAHWFLRELRAREEFERLPIDEIRLRASSGPGQWASAEWSSRTGDPCGRP